MNEEFIGKLLAARFSEESDETFGYVDREDDVNLFACSVRIRFLGTPPSFAYGWKTWWFPKLLVRIVDDEEAALVILANL